ncbi:hypothetical protein ACP4OV_003637 [Aristida adscensionis]
MTWRCFDLARPPPLSRRVAFLVSVTPPPSSIYTAHPPPLISSPPQPPPLPLVVDDMLLAAAMRTDSAHAPSSASAPPPPWLPADHRHLLHDLTASPAPTPAAVRTPPHHHHLRAAGARRAAKRRPRPSRRLPTTYISADPASFRRMVHQVTGADDLPLPPPPEALLHRPAPSRPGAQALLLPTLDTSAFLLAPPSLTASPSPCGSLGASPALAPALEAADGNGAGEFGFPTLESWDALF